jgi:hypothetical protein
MSFIDDNQKDKISEFVRFVKNELGLKECPRVILQNGKGKLKTTANYDYTKDEKVIRINCKNRAMIDVMRSIAHEIVHHKQFEDGRLKVKPPDVGGEIEDEANARAGQYIKMFGRIDNSIYEL